MEYWIEKLKALLISRRFQAAVAGVLIILLQDVFSIPEDKAQWIAGVIMTWIVGDSISTTSSPKMEAVKAKLRGDS